jgi:hypothetical protein
MVLIMGMVTFVVEGDSDDNVCDNIERILSAVEIGCEDVPYNVTEDIEEIVEPEGGHG